MTNVTRDEQRAHRREWAGILRSGQYPQAQGSLRTPECALAYLNDYGYTFEWTAAGIEAAPPGLFQEPSPCP